MDSIKKFRFFLYVQILIVANCSKFNQYRKKYIELITELSIQILVYR